MEQFGMLAGLINRYNLDWWAQEQSPVTKFRVLLSSKYNLSLLSKKIHNRYLTHVEIVRLNSKLRGVRRRLSIMYSQTILHRWTSCLIIPAAKLLPLAVSSQLVPSTITSKMSSYKVSLHVMYLHMKDNDIPFIFYKCSSESEHLELLLLLLR